MISPHGGYIHLAVSDICLTTSDIRLTASHGIHLYVAIFLNEEHKVYSRNLGEASHASADICLLKITALLQVEF